MRQKLEYPCRRPKNRFQGVADADSSCLVSFGPRRFLFTVPTPRGKRRSSPSDRCAHAKSLQAHAAKRRLDALDSSPSDLEGLEIDSLFRQTRDRDPLAPPRISKILVVEIVLTPWPTAHRRGSHLPHPTHLPRESPLGRAQDSGGTRSTRPPRCSLDR